MRFNAMALPASIIVMLAIPTLASITYKPTTLLSSPADSGSLIYLFKEMPPSSSNVQFLALNASSSLDSARISYTTISPSLPFLQDGEDDSFIPIVDSQGNITVYAGACLKGGEGATLWRFTPHQRSGTINGTWSKMNLSSNDVDTNNGLNGANYLASGISFSSTVNASSNFYIFGGMCPNANASVASDWIQDAAYSNSMLTLTSEGYESQSSAGTYDLGLSPSRGPPIPEAGFTISPLELIFSNATKDARSQQQVFVLLGGHTQQAFINMSQVALFSLPQQSWSFLPVGAPVRPDQTGLAAGNTQSVEPRSGHTSVLTADCKRIIVFGGWVGNLSTPAIPQLAILELGEDYGGDGDWQWSIPAQNGTEGSINAAGLYGHGAVMLPGEVMMVVGGYAIDALGNSKIKRTEPLSNTQTYFYNITSNEWANTYYHPQVNSLSTSASNLIILTSAGRAGLGSGLALGFSLILCAFIVYFWYNRRLRRRREARERELASLALDPHYFHSDTFPAHDEEKSALEGLGNRQDQSKDIYPWAPTVIGGPDRPGRRMNGASDAERTGLLVEIPSPTRGLRRSLHTRGSYMPAPRYDDRRRNRGSGTIHVIDERDEDEENTIEQAPLAEPQMKQRLPIDLLGTAPVLDPYVDPLQIYPRTPSPQSPAREREIQVQKWVNDWSAADALMHSNPGRISPDKTDRTSSTLSDQSFRSAQSSHSLQTSVGSFSRSISQRSAALFHSKPLSANNNPLDTSLRYDGQRTRDGPRGPQSSQSFQTANRRSQSLSILPRQRRGSNPDTFTVSRTPMSQLQGESEALLGGQAITEHEPEPARLHSRTRGWMGSMRRAFGGDRSVSASPENGEYSATSSPTKSVAGDSGLPRRAASASAMLWRRKQGARDWDVEDGDQGRVGDDKDDDGREWDVESAVENRVVQLMFTVPKGKLRIVNAGPDGDGVSVVSQEGELGREEQVGGDLKGKSKAT